MSSVLDRIITRTRHDLAERQAQRPLERFRADLRPSQRSFKAALAGSACGYVLECKKASPSRGLIRADFDVACIADAYAPFASAISVLTDRPFFKGSHDYLATVAQRVPCPVLCKDFNRRPLPDLRGALPWGRRGVADVFRP